jgi:hypothetical protein
MNILGMSIVFFIIGTIEYFINQYERLVSVRLKLGLTILFSILNQTIEVLMYIFLFGILISFWDNWHKGIHDYFMLVPYILYTCGKIFGTVLAPWVYAQLKKKNDHEKTLKLISKTNKKGKKHSKKKYNKMVDDAVTKMSTETLLDPIETEDLKNEIKQQVIDNVAKTITNKVDEALNPGEGKNNDY